MTVLSAVIGVATPLLAGDVVNEITSPDGTVHGVVWLAVFIAGLAVVDTVLGLISRWFSSRIGEGLIFDMRTRVFEHVQKMSLAFFTRTQTGALVSRLNNDVIGAQQAFTSTLSGVVSNVIGLVLTAAVMFTLSWQVTTLSLILLPLFVLPARWFGRRLQALTRESYNLNASMNTTTTERFNVSGALLVTLFGRPDREAESFRDRAGRVRDIGITSAMYGRVFIAALTLVAALAQALTYGLGGALAINGSLDAGAVVSLALLLTRLYGPFTALSNVRVDVMSALVSFERVFEVLDLKPLVIDKPDAPDLPTRRAIRRVRRRALRLPRRGRGLADLAGGRRRSRPDAETSGAARGVVLRRTGPAGRAGRSVGCRQDHHLRAGAAHLRRRHRCRAHRRDRRP